MKKLILLVCLMLLGCGKEEPKREDAPSLVGSWWTLIGNGDCGIGLEISGDGKFATQTACIEQNILYDEMSVGTYQATEDELILTPTKSTCDEDPPATFNYKLDTHLSLITDDGIFILKRNVETLRDNQSVIAVFGCYSDDGFIEQPMRDL